MKTPKTTIAKVNATEVNAKFANADKIAKANPTKKAGTRKPKVTKVVAPEVVEDIIDVTGTPEVAIPTVKVDKLAEKREEHNQLFKQLQDAQEKHNAAKSANTKKKYAKLCETILEEMQIVKDEYAKLEKAGKSEATTTGSAPMGEKVRLADLPIGSCYKYRESGAIYKLLKVDGAMIEAAESNGKTFIAKAANYKVFQVEEGVQA